ncbi:MAG: hypothetical protein ACOY0T_21385 [Myxococcota bacterium]
MALLPALEQPLVQAREQLGASVCGDEATLRDVLMTGLTSMSSYWFELAVSWIEQGFPIDAEIAATIRGSSSNASLSQKYRHRAFQMVRRWERSRESE